MCKKPLWIIVACILVTSLFGCGGGNQSQTQEQSGNAEPIEASNTMAVSYKGISVDVNDQWTEKDADEGKYIYTDYDGMVYIFASDISGITESSAEEMYDNLVEGLISSGEMEVSGRETIDSYAPAIAYRSDVTFNHGGKHFKGSLETVIVEDRVYMVLFVIPDAAFDEHAGDIPSVLNTIKLDNPSAPVFSSSSVPTNSSNILSFGSTFTFDSFDIQIGDSISTTTLDNQFSDKDGSTVIVLPITLTNLGNKSAELNMFYVKEFGSSGLELDSIYPFFNDDARMAGQMRPGASMTAPLYFLYDGDGTYVIEFKMLAGDAIEVEIPVSLG